MRSLILLVVFSLISVNGFCAEEADQNIVDFNLSGFGKKGEKTWEIKAKSADIFTDEVRLNDIQALIYSKDQDLTLTADRGSYIKSKGAMHVESNVVATTADGAKMTTDSLDWSEKAQKMTAPDFVKVERNNLLTTATGMEAKPSLKNIEFKKDVTVQILPESSPKTDNQQDNQDNKDKKPTIITCDGPLEIDYEKNIATFYENVKVDNDQMNLFSDKMDVYFVSGAKSGQETSLSNSLNQSNIKKIVARGNVRIVQGENQTFSEEAVYTTDDKKVVLTGRPKLIIYSTEGFKDAIIGN
ncbi:MAG: LPS export ABC transporter periplasmic protein LptC [Candidatus Omnitrophota bacterium]